MKRENIREAGTLSFLFYLIMEMAFRFLFGT